MRYNKPRMKLQNRKWPLLTVGVVLVILLAGIYWFTSHHAPAAPSGIEGTVSYGPLCPTEPCPLGTAQPNYNFYVVASKLDGTKVGQVLPDQNGNYRLTIAPGTYRVTVSRSFASAMGNQPPTAVVKTGQYTHLDLSFDTGIR